MPGMMVRPRKSTTRASFGIATLPAAPTAARRPPSTTSTAFARGGLPVPSIRRAPLSAITSAKAACDAARASATKRVFFMLIPLRRVAGRIAPSARIVASDARPKMPDHFIPTDALHKWMVELWRAAGSNEREATLTADHLVAANLAGHDSHGVGMAPLYVRALLGGELQLNQKVEVASGGGGLLVIDGQPGLAQSAGLQAM